jgi:hypothetical protein
MYFPELLRCSEGTLSRWIIIRDSPDIKSCTAVEKADKQQVEEKKFL